MSIAARIVGLFAPPARSSDSATDTSRIPETASPVSGCVRIDVPEPSAEDQERDRWQSLGLRLARQEDWERLSAALRQADADRRLTEGGMAVADLIAYGARADAVGAVEHALLDGIPADDAPLLDGIEALEDVLEDYGDDYPIALIVALAHIDMAWAWHRAGGQAVRGRNAHLSREAFEAHMDRAADVLAPFRGQELTSPALLSAFCALAAEAGEETGMLADTYGTLIDLNPRDLRPLRALGAAMLPEQGGSLERLELEARRSAARVSPDWGAGGYALVMLDAISADDAACAALDAEYFIEGLRDILARTPSQFVVNLLAAHCAVTMRPDGAPDATQAVRAQIHACAAWIIREHMTELHPLVWAHATRGFDSSVRVRSVDRFARLGLTEGLAVLKSVFAADLGAGRNVTITRNGPVSTAG